MSDLNPQRTSIADALPPPLPVHLTSERTLAALCIQQCILQSARRLLAARGFVELLAPILGPVTDPGSRGAKQVDVDYYGHRYKLMTSVILYKQAALLGFDKIFYVAPNVRLEPPDAASTGRHLAEFHQLDIEVANADRAEVMGLANDLVAAAVRDVCRTLPAELEQLGRDPGSLAHLLRERFAEMTHPAAVATLNGVGHPQSPDGEIDWEGERLLSLKQHQPFFITDYPKGSRGFYDRENAEDPGRLVNFDLLAPEGYGELCSGGEREHDYATVVTRMRETGENPAKYRWYLDMVRAGIPRSAGFGIGIERLTRYIGGLDAVWQAAAYPKVPGVESP